MDIECIGASGRDVDWKNVGPEVDNRQKRFLPPAPRVLEESVCRVLRKDCWTLWLGLVGAPWAANRRWPTKAWLDDSGRAQLLIPADVRSPRVAGALTTDRVSSLVLRDCSKAASAGGPKTSPGTNGAAMTAMQSWSNKLAWDSHTWRRAWTILAMDCPRAWACALVPRINMSTTRNVSGMLSSSVKVEDKSCSRPSK